MPPIDVSETPESAVERLAQAVLENRVQVVQSSRSGTYEIRVKPTPEQLAEMQSSRG